MKVFYIPDGHRRYADKVGCSLRKAYRVGYEVLVDEVVEPLFARPDVDAVDVFLLSNLNLRRRAPADLDVLLRDGEHMLWELIDRCAPLAEVRTLGSYLQPNVTRPGPDGKLLTLVLGCTTDDDVGCEQTDVFIRSGGEIRLSGAPRQIIGNYTQLYGIDVLHPELRYADVAACLDHYAARYVREGRTP